jgi:hypothetical protein
MLLQPQVAASLRCIIRDIAALALLMYACAVSEHSGCRLATSHAHARNATTFPDYESSIKSGAPYASWRGAAATVVHASRASGAQVLHVRYVAIKAVHAPTHGRPRCAEARRGVRARVQRGDVTIGHNDASRARFATASSFMPSALSGPDATAALLL